MSEFVIGTTNDQTDRVVLAANDGTVIALHDRAYPTPLALHAPPPQPSKPEVATPAKPAEEKKPAEDETKPPEEKKPPAGEPKNP